ncbi:hypothetical protein DKT74_31325 [Streptomyces sp. ZEA17I]|nr:hypothetical protein DKT74_31325 [Streptomyces sp. ZEA17I]
MGCPRVPRARLGFLGRQQTGSGFRTGALSTSLPLSGGSIGGRRRGRELADDGCRTTNQVPGRRRGPAADVGVDEASDFSLAQTTVLYCGPEAAESTRLRDLVVLDDPPALHRLVARLIEDYGNG